MSRITVWLCEHWCWHKSKEWSGLVILEQPFSQCSWWRIALRAVFQWKTWTCTEHICTDDSCLGWPGTQTPNEQPCTCIIVALRLSLIACAASIPVTSSGLYFYVIPNTSLLELPLYYIHFSGLSQVCLCTSCQKVLALGVKTQEVITEAV